MAGVPDPKHGWPCQHPVETTPDRLVSALYVLLRDHVAPGDMEQVLIQVAHDREVDFTNPHLEQLARAHASYLLSGPGALPTFPHPDGDVLVLGPACFISEDGEVINYQGVNFRNEGQAPREEPASDAG